MTPLPPPFRPPPRFKWPGDASVAVMLCFDVDGETTALSEDPALVDRLTTYSQCRYGPEIGVPRLLGLLDHYQVPGTFFIPSWVAQHHPEMTRAVVASGHEVGAHGHLHEKLPTLTPEEEATVLVRSCDLLEGITGSRPRGHRAPWFELNPGTPDLLHREGFLYSASLMSDDVPFQHPNGLVEIPGQWLLEDWEQFAFNADPAWGLIPEDCDKVFTLWWREFEAMRDYGCCFVLTLHPWLSGRPSRVQLLERMLRGMLEAGDVWFAKGEEIARYVADHPEARREIDLDRLGAP